MASSAGEPNPLTPEQRESALALYRHLLHLHRMDNHMALVSFSDTGVSVRPIGRRVDIGAQAPQGGALITG